MTANIAPAAPESLPKYLIEGIPKQDIETLEETRDYIDELIEHKRRPVPESEIPDDAQVVDDDKQKGTIYIRKNTCGDETCHCLNGGEKHGPYKYLVFRDDSGNVITEYEGKA